MRDPTDMVSRCDMIAIGILVMQDIFAVVFLAASEGKYPSLWALLVLLLPFLRPALYKLIDAAGHGELLILSGLFFALALGYEAFTLANYSEFGLIVAALGVAQGWLPTEWLLVIAIAVSLSFAIAAPFSKEAESAYQGLKAFWDRHQRSQLHPEDQPIEIADARVLVIGMGRVGRGAYEALSEFYGDQIVDIEHDAQRVEAHQADGRRVLLGDATDTDFWAKLGRSDQLELIVLAMPAHHSNLYAAQHIRKAKLPCHVVAVVQFQDEVSELAGLDVPAFNMYSEAGLGLARHALDSIRAR